ncbi:MAG: putative carboxymethylenebutenolidase [Acidimicrobiia bacterium]|nr:MAG: putative carboxymethylenebutenolidase [Acidimicrobiia bacterium]
MAVLPHEGTYTIMYGPWPIPVGAGYRNGYIARPDKEGRFPTIILSPDINGITAHEKYVARRLARLGLAVVAVDFYPTRPGPGDDPLAAYAAVDDRAGTWTLDEAYQFLSSDDIDWAHTSKVGVMGLDVGGRFAAIVASRRPWVGGLVLVSTPIVGDEDRENQMVQILGRLAVPVLGLYGADDDLVPSETVDLAQETTPAGQFLLYAGAGHGFMDEVGPDFHPGAAEDAILRIAEFFQAVLPPPQLEELG